MAEKNDNIKNNSEKQPKTPNLGEDFEKWLQGREQQKYFLEKKNSLDTQSRLADLRESLGKRSYEKKSSLSSDIPQGSTFHSEESVAFTDKIQTRQIGDEEKGVFQGLVQSVGVPLRAFRDGVIDGGKILFSPIQETKRTIAYLEEESSAKII